MRLASFFGFDGGGIIVDGISMQASYIEFRNAYDRF